MGGAVLSADGRLFYCKNSAPLGDCGERSAAAIYFDPASLAYRREGLKKGRCPSCPPYTMNQQEIARDIIPLLSFLAFGRPKDKEKR